MCKAVAAALFVGCRSTSTFVGMDQEQLTYWIDTIDKCKGLTRTRIIVRRG